METSHRVQPPPIRQPEVARATASAPARSQIPLHAKIAERAYQIWQAAGCPHGQHEDHWYQAERELRTRR